MTRDIPAIETPSVLWPRHIDARLSACELRLRQVPQVLAKTSHAGRSRGYFLFRRPFPLSNGNSHWGFRITLPSELFDRSAACPSRL
jgi:hypothetical protein